MTAGEGGGVETRGGETGGPQTGGGETKRRLLSGLVLDRALSPRARLGANHVRQLAEALQAGATLPPIVVERDHLPRGRRLPPDRGLQEGLRKRSPHRGPGGKTTRAPQSSLSTPCT